MRSLLLLLLVIFTASATMVQDNGKVDEDRFAAWHLYTRVLLNLVRAFNEHDQVSLAKMFKQPLDIHEYLNAHTNTSRLDFRVHSVTEDRNGSDSEYYGFVDLIVTNGKERKTYPTDLQISFKMGPLHIKIVSLKRHDGQN
uniref:Salivary secreted peptide n=1 Tax=Caenorhabditis tropicalis TaxID=1561998 RepID=A0A1I7UEZ4_9PELO